MGGNSNESDARWEAVHDKLDGIKEDVKTGHSYISGRLDEHAKQMQEHLVQDATNFTELRHEQQVIRGQLNDKIRADREASERRHQAALTDSQLRAQAEQALIARKDNWKIAKLAAVVTVLAALVAAWYANHLENKDRKVTLEEIKAKLEIPK